MGAAYLGLLGRLEAARTLGVSFGLERMRAALAARGIPFTILVIPRRDQVRSPAAFTAFDQRIGRITTELSIADVDPLSALREAYAREGERLFIAWDGHDAGPANQVIAESLARALSEPSAP